MQQIHDGAIMHPVTVTDKIVDLAINHPANSHCPFKTGVLLIPRQTEDSALLARHLFQETMLTYRRREQFSTEAAPGFDRFCQYGNGGAD